MHLQIDLGSDLVVGCRFWWVLGAILQGVGMFCTWCWDVSRYGVGMRRAPLNVAYRRACRRIVICTFLLSISILLQFNIIMLLSIISIVFNYFRSVTATEPDIGPIVFNSTDWSKYGYPILNRPVEYPYMFELFNGSKVVIYESGPSNINLGDLLLIQTNGAQYKVNNEWYLVGAVGPDGKYFKISDEYVNALGIDNDDVINYNSFHDVEVFINDQEKVEGQVLTSELEILSYYEQILWSRQKALNDDRTQVLPKT